MSEGPLPAQPAPFAGRHATGGPVHPVVVDPKSSGFLSLPDGLRWAEGESAGVGVTFPRGFSAAGVPCGIKESGSDDVALLTADDTYRDICSSAAVLTRNAFAAAPVRLCRESTSLDRLVGLAMNSGNANAATGAEGLQVALAMRRRAGEALSCAPERIGVASTGVIGVPLAEATVTSGIEQAARELSPAGGGRFARAIMTTDRFPKVAHMEVDLSGGTVRVGGAAKGAGMIAPGLATMLCAVTTDVRMSPGQAETMLSGAAGATFNRISVDGEMSTNDAVFLLANGASDVSIVSEAGTQTSPDEERLAASLETLMGRLALMIVADGEGASKVARVRIDGAPSDTAAEAAARGVANSLLVKTALHGEDPNWGRILSAVGAALAGGDFPRTELLIGDVLVVQDSAAVVLEEEEAARLRGAVRSPEVDLAIDLKSGTGRALAYFSDIGHEYVTINAEYHT